MVQDPYGYMTSLGLTAGEIEHVQRVHVATVMGDKAPTELRTLVQMGPQISATSAIASDLQALSRRLDEQDSERKSQAARDSFKSLIADKTKYPLLSKAYTAAPHLFDARVDGKGNVEELAKSIEAEQVALAAAYGVKVEAQPASENAETNTSQSKQAQPALAGAMSGDAPPIQQKKPGVFTPEEHVALRDEILRKHAPKQTAY